MQKVTFNQFVAEIETTFSNYSDTNSIDRLSIKTWVIQALRKFGKNICDTNETLVEVKNGRALLPESFKSLILAVKVDMQPKKDKQIKELVYENHYIENPVVWDSIAREHVINYCDTKFKTEKKYAVYEYEDNQIGNVTILSPQTHINKDTLDVNCLNLHPLVRNNNPNKFSVTNRTLNTSFKEGFVYITYNSLPMEDGEVAIPIITNGAIYDYIENHVKWKLAEFFVLNNMNPQGLSSLFATWKQEDIPLFIKAQSEGKYSSLNNSNWAEKMYMKNYTNRRKLGL